MEARMSFLDRLDAHADLMHRMAETTGADLGTAVLEGRVGPMELRSLYLSCTRCDAPEACAEWLEGHADGSAAPPDFCRNRQSLDRLRQS